MPPLRGQRLPPRRDERELPRLRRYGIVDPDLAEDLAEGRRDLSEAEKAQLGKAGKAVYYDGGWHFPPPTRSDYDNAVRALGRTPGKPRATVRRYLIRRARAEGWPIPSSWKSDGTVGRAVLAPNDSDLLLLDLMKRRNR